MTPVGALEIGGSHVSVALVESASGVLRGYARSALVADVSLTAFLAAVGETVSGLGEHADPAGWAIAIPGPFDYVSGVGGVHPAGKLAALAGVDVRAALAPVLGTDDIIFVNDATAFALGCFRDLHDQLEVHRIVALTFGSGLGSAFVEDGRVVLDARVPPGGEVYCLPATSDSAEVTIESRFGPAALAAARGFDSFRTLSAYARTDPATTRMLRSAFTGLADALGPWLRRFRPDAVVCGGGACRAWDIFGDSFAARLAQHAGEGLRVESRPDTEQTALRGAALVAAARPTVRVSSTGSREPDGATPGTSNPVE